MLKFTFFLDTVSLKITSDSEIFINPDIVESNIISDWFNANKANFHPNCLSLNNISSIFTKSDISSIVKLVHRSEAQYFIFDARILYVYRDKLFYQSCPIQSCNKKVQPLTSKKFKCLKCNKIYDILYLNLYSMLIFQIKQETFRLLCLINKHLIYLKSKHIKLNHRKSLI